MTTQFKLPPGLSSTDRINHWADRYTKTQTGAQKAVEKYLMSLEDTVQERKTISAPSGYLSYNELYDLVYWKLKRSRWISKNSEFFVRKVTGEAFCLDDDWEKLNKLTDLYGVGQSVASAILHLCDEKKYPILDQHALRSIGIKQKDVYGPKYPFWQEYVAFCCATAKRYNVSMRTLDQALWKYSEVGIQENEELRHRKYPRTGGPLGVTMPDGKQLRRRYGVDTFVEVIEEIGVERVKRLNIIYGDNPLIRDKHDLLMDRWFDKFDNWIFHDERQWKESGPYEIRNPGAIYRQANLLREVAKRLNINLIVDTSL